MDLKKIGLIIAIAGIVFTVYFKDDWDFLVLGLTFVMFGFLIALIGILEAVKKQKTINDKLDVDIPLIIQPIISKYSNLNKEYKRSCSEEEYVEKRLAMNRDMEKELAENLPYLSSSDIKKIVIEFNRDQDKE